MQLLKNGIICPSNSSWASPIVIVPKKDGKGGLTPRIYTDYWKINQVTIKDAFLIPRINDILEHMPLTIGYFSIFDLFMGYNQIGIDKDAIAKSAFITP